MRILFLSTYFRPDVASTGVIMTTLAEEFVARGHEVTVVTSVPHYGTNQVWPEYSKKLVYSERRQGCRFIVFASMWQTINRALQNVFWPMEASACFQLLEV